MITTRSKSARNQRLGPADYFAAAFDLLADGGAAALTTTDVCARLGVTTGSLYHHFASGAAFYQAFIDHWENAVSPALRDRVDRVLDPVERVEFLFQIAANGNHNAEKAIRAWSNIDPMVAAAQRRVDEARELHLTDAYLAAGIPAERAATLARIGFAILIGSQQLDDVIDRDRLTDSLHEYKRWVHSHVPAHPAPGLLGP